MRVSNGCMSEKVCVINEYAYPASLFLSRVYQIIEFVAQINEVFSFLDISVSSRIFFSYLMRQFLAPSCQSIIHCTAVWRLADAHGKADVVGIPPSHVPLPCEQGGAAVAGFTYHQGLLHHAVIARKIGAYVFQMFLETAFRNHFLLFPP